MEIKKQYFITLGLVLGLLLANQIFIQLSLLRAQQDSRIINIAGKQRLYSQKMYAAILEEEWNTDVFLKTVGSFRDSHEELIFRTTEYFLVNDQISQLNQITPYIYKLDKFIQLPEDEFWAARSQIQKVLQNMLVLSDEVVNIIENEQQLVIKRVRIFELLITIISVLVIGYEVFLVILPVLRRLRVSRQELQIKTEELNRLIGMIGHDLRSPLQNMKSRIQLIRIKNPEKNQSREDLDILLNSLESAEQIVQLMLERNMNNQAISPKEVIIGQIIDDVKRDLTFLIDSTQAEIYIKGDARIKLNPTELRLVFQNIISNAIKFTKKDKIPRINITVTDFHSKLKVTVTDYGIGMSEEIQSNIFEYRSRGNLEDQSAEGYGIGLSHCKAIITDLGGSIWVKSKTDEGSRFYLELPKQQL